MAIEKFGSELLCLMRRKGIDLGDFLTLGRQHFCLDPIGTDRISDLAGFPVSEFLDEDLDSCYVEPFLKKLGARSVLSVDYSDYEGADFVHDMNLPVADSMKNRFDVVYDGGTLEHLFHFPQAISNAMQMVKPGGYFLCSTPSNGLSGHGFYQFSPELFFRLFSEDRGFRIRLMALGESIRRGRLYSVRDPKETGVRVGLNNGRPTYLVLAAQKVGAIPETMKFPSQSGYESMWADAGNKEPGLNSKGKDGIRSLLKRLTPNRLLEIRNERLIRRRDREKMADVVQRIGSLEEVWQ